jgi:hypothetical protein
MTDGATERKTDRDEEAHLKGTVIPMNEENFIGLLEICINSLVSIVPHSNRKSFLFIIQPYISLHT